MQRKGHWTWHRNEMPENHCVIWPSWEHLTPEQLTKDVDWLFGQGVKGYFVGVDHGATGDDYGAEVTAQWEKDGSVTVVDIRLTGRDSDAD